MSSLISLVVVDQEPRVDSRLIASQLGVEHKNTRSLIEQYQNALENFGKVPFETEASGKTNQPQKFYLLNEDQSYLLLTLTRNTDQAVQLKIRLVRAFGEQRRAIALPASPDLPLLESSLVLDFQGVPIRFLIDRNGNWQATYADVATALGFVNKEQQYNARNILKYNVKAGERQLRHPLYGDLIALSGMNRVLAQFARNAACEPERAALADHLKDWLAQVAAPLVAKPASAGFLLSQQGAARIAGQRSLAFDPDYQQSAHLITLWHRALGEYPYRASDVLAQAQGPLADALAEVARNRWFSALLSAKRLGKWLSLRQGQAIDGLMISSIMDRCRKIRLWSIQQVAP